MVNTSGNATAEPHYLPFGEARLTAAFPTDRRFTGQRAWRPRAGPLRDALLFGIGALRQRRPIVPDPTNPQALNRCAFVLNNPLRYIDPSGLTSACGFSYSDPECAEAGIVPAHVAG